jgi:hypothetical protein
VEISNLFLLYHLEFLMSKAKDLPLNQPVKFFSNEIFLKLRQSETEEELEAFEWFFGDFMECVCGKRIWGIQKYQELISKARDKETGGIIVTISDEAFGLLLIDNYRAKWISKVEAARRGEVPRSGERLPGKYTNSKLGNSEYAGWTIQGTNKFNRYFDHVVEDRKEAMRTGNLREEEFLQHMRSTDKGKRTLDKVILAQRRIRPSDPAGPPMESDARIDMSW